MSGPVEISFHNMARSEALERRVRERIGKLQRLHHQILSYRVVLDAPHRQGHKGSLGIRVELGVRGKDVVVKREQKLNESDNHAIWVINEAFDAAERQLGDIAAIRRHDVKSKGAEALVGRVVRLFPEQDYGFIETASGQNLFFSRAVVRDDRFAELEVGSDVLYTAAADEGPMGPQASTVQPLTGSHPVR